MNEIDIYKILKIKIPKDYKFKSLYIDSLLIKKLLLLSKKNESITNDNEDYHLLNYSFPNFINLNIMKNNNKIFLCFDIILHNSIVDIIINTNNNSIKYKCGFFDDYNYLKFYRYYAVKKQRIYLIKYWNNCILPLIQTQLSNIINKRILEEL